MNDSGNAYGFIEITGVVAALDCLDIMCKAADVSLATWERKLGGRLVTLVVEGSVSAVKSAVEAGREQAIKRPVAWGVIANPHPETVKLVALSASRFKGNQEPSSEPKLLGDDPPDFVPKRKEAAVPRGDIAEAADKLAKTTGESKNLRMGKTGNKSRTVRTGKAGNEGKTVRRSGDGKKDK